LQKKHPGLVGWAEEPDIRYQISDVRYQNEKTDELFRNVAQKIHDTKTRMVFVGLGAPKQEYFIEKLATCNMQLETPLVLMSVGGSFDIIAGKTPRAPFILRTIGLEWIWRLICEPWRWRRQAKLLRFVWLVVKKKYVSQSQTVRN
jgi:exopolysaccharide biosynthesis WecB/TagA/CpsF family protein